MEGNGAHDTIRPCLCPLPFPLVRSQRGYMGGEGSLVTCPGDPTEGITDGDCVFL
jgi:hypothetical protein